MEKLLIRCRKCRSELFSTVDSPILTVHAIEVNGNSIHYPPLEQDCRDSIDSLYLQELGLPGWILSLVNEGSWQKGKVKCPKCSARLGSFDFVSGRKCACGTFIIPPVHIIKSKIDHQIIKTTE